MYLHFIIVCIQTIRLQYMIDPVLVGQFQKLITIRISYKIVLCSLCSPCFFVLWSFIDLHFIRHVPSRLHSRLLSSKMRGEIWHFPASDARSFWRFAMDSWDPVRLNFHMVACVLLKRTGLTFCRFEETMFLHFYTQNRQILLFKVHGFHPLRVAIDAWGSKCFTVVAHKACWVGWHAQGVGLDDWMIMIRL